VAIRRLLAETYVEALRDGPYGWIDDVFALRSGWGFDLARIAVPVRLWHGELDSLSPVSHSRWLATRIPGAEVQVQAGLAHFGAVEILPQILAWLKAGFLDSAAWRAQPAAVGWAADTSGRVWIDDPVQMPPLA
jgi:pimeloyl-ACP methyl ester carboxylesterase